jgi:hypothetical protein
LSLGLIARPYLAGSATESWLTRTNLRKFLPPGLTGGLESGESPNGVGIFPGLAVPSLVVAVPLVIAAVVLWIKGKETAGKRLEEIRYH